MQVKNSPMRSGQQSSCEIRRRPTRIPTRRPACSGQRHHPVPPGSQPTMAGGTSSMEPELQGLGNSAACGYCPVDCTTGPGNTGSILVSTTAKKKKRRTPTYLQSVALLPMAALALSISSLLGAAPRLPILAAQTGGLGGGGQCGPPGPLNQQLGRVSRSPLLPPLLPSSEDYTPPLRSPRPTQQG